MECRFPPFIWVFVSVGILVAGSLQISAGDDESSTVELDPYVVTVSRFEEEALKAPASISVVTADRFLQDGVPSVVETLRTVPGVDIHQAGMGRYLVAVRGFNNAFGSTTYAMVDNRESFNPALGLIAYKRLPIDLLDIERVEVVRGPGSALYGPGVSQGIIHFITKDPFEHPGTSVSIGVGEQSLRQASFRHAGVIKNKLGYKITGSFMEAEDWQLDPDDPHDAEILGKIIPELKDLNGEVVRVIDGRDYSVYFKNLTGQLQYRFTKETKLTAYAGYSKTKNIYNASLGEIQTDGPATLEGQLQFQSGGFYAQAYGITEYVDGDNWFYRAGDLMYGRSSQIDLQAKYQLDLWNDRETITVGADYKITTPKSQGTIFGRFEEDDQFSSYGAYLHSVTHVNGDLNFTASGRLDYADATGNTAFSPRLALVYQSTPEHTFRLTYNRALSRPSATDFFGDLQVGQTPAFQIRFLGTANGFNFPDPRQTTSFVGPGRDPGIGIATARVYGALAEVVASELQEDNPENLANMLLSRTAEIDGISEGIMTFRSTAGELLRIAPTIQDIDPIRETVTQVFELGYKGVIDEIFVIGIDGYYTQKEGFLFTHVITPFVEIPGETLSNDLANSVNDVFTDEELAPFGINVATLASTYATIGASMGDQPLGILEPDQTYNPDTLPEMIMVNLNAGTLDYVGLDFSVEAFFNDHWSAFANYSWVSNNFFDDETIGLPETGFVVSMNSPEHKVRAGVIYRTGSGLTVSSTLRYVGGFRVADGTNYNGLVDSYTVVDFGLVYDFSGSATGLNLAITVQNVLDDRHREYIGFPTIGRLITSRLAYTF